MLEVGVVEYLFTNVTVDEVAQRWFHIAASLYLYVSWRRQ